MCVTKYGHAIGILLRLFVLLCFVVVFTPHTEREWGKVISVGLLCLWGGGGGGFEYRLTFSNICRLLVEFID